MPKRDLNSMISQAATGGEIKRGPDYDFPQIQTPDADQPAPQPERQMVNPTQHVAPTPIPPPTTTHSQQHGAVDIERVSMSNKYRKDLVKSLKRLAVEQERDIRDLMEDAMFDYLEKHQAL